MQRPSQYAMRQQEPGMHTCVAAVAEGRVCEQRRGYGLQRDAYPHLLHHVRLVLKVQVHLIVGKPLSGVLLQAMHVLSTDVL